MPEHLSPKLINWASILEDNTRDQALTTASMPFVFPHVALMPDAHLGRRHPDRRAGRARGAHPEAAAGRARRPRGGQSRRGTGSADRRARAGVHLRVGRRTPGAVTGSVGAAPGAQAEDVCDAEVELGPLFSAGSNPARGSTRTTHAAVAQSGEAQQPTIKLATLQDDEQLHPLHLTSSGGTWWVPGSTPGRSSKACCGTTQWQSALC